MAGAVNAKRCTSLPPTRDQGQETRNARPSLVNPSRALVIGTGFVGRPLARLLQANGWEVTATVRSAEAAAAMAAAETFRVRPADVTRPETLTALGAYDRVFHCASSSRGGAPEYRKIFIEGVRCLQQAFPEARLTLCGSTSVYGQTDGSVVDEASLTAPERETGRILLEAETLVLAAGGSVVRLAGLYGPERCVPLRKLLEGTAVLEGDGERWLNNLRGEDAASALLHVAALPGGDVYNASDDEPVRQRDWFGWVCARLGRPLPPLGPRDFGRKRAWTHKAVSNAKLRGTRWRPAYPTFREGLAELLASISQT